MGDNHRGKLAAVPAPPAAAAARLTITAFIDRPPTLECTGGLVEAMRLLSAALAMMANSVQQGSQQAPAGPIEDKKREYLGPRK